MAYVTDKIMRILHECHPNKNDFKDKVKNPSESKESRKKIETEKFEKIKSNAEKLLADAQCNYVGSVEYANLNKMLAICNLEVIESLNYVTKGIKLFYKICIYLNIL